MTQRSMFFDSSSGDRVYTSDSWAQIFGRVFSDGVVAGYASGMAVAASGPAAMTVSVPLGSLWVQGRFLDVYSAAETLTVLTSDPTNPRIDRVVARIDYTGRTLALAVLKGTAAASPVAPALTQNTTTWEMSLAQIRVNAGATSIVAGNITDERTFITNAAAIGFGKVKAGASTLTATVAGDMWEMVAGANIALTPDTVNKKITVAVAEGSGSGLNADTLDGLDSTGFALAVHNHDTLYLKRGDTTGLGSVRLFGSGQAVLELLATVGGQPSALFLSDDSSLAANGSLTYQSGVMKLASTGTVSVQGNTALTGTLSTSGGVTVAAGGVTVSGGGAAVTGNSTVTGTLTASAGLTVSSGGAAITGNSTVTGTLAASGAITSGSVPVPTLVGGGTKISTQGTAPTSPATGDIWIDTSIVL